jgi:hypothetical protein
MTSHLHHILRIVFCVAIAGCLAGCAPNMRYVLFGNLWTMGEIKKGAPVLYPAIWINATTNKPMPRISLRLQNGQIVPLSSFTNQITIPSDDVVAIGREDEKTFSTPPFTLETLEHIFGHPDSVSDGYFH